MTHVCNNCDSDVSSHDVRAGRCNDCGQIVAMGTDKALAIAAHVVLQDKLLAIAPRIASLREMYEERRRLAHDGSRLWVDTLDSLKQELDLALAFQKVWTEAKETLERELV